ncbi:MAG TPA: hypothetical protein PKL17_15400 [Pseudomonadota bacterium]|nr:hypothetical protein [Pseudomonadota bacterium]HNK46170.1 hypothetical protein [Pseudomonadota bacterium]
MEPGRAEQLSVEHNRLRLRKRHRNLLRERIEVGLTDERFAEQHPVDLERIGGHRQTRRDELKAIEAATGLPRNPHAQTDIGDGGCDEQSIAWIGLRDSIDGELGL